MLLEQHVFNLQEVGEKSLADIKNECLFHFAGSLRYLIYKEVEDSHRGSINFGNFASSFGNFVKFNNKNIVFESTVPNYDLIRLCAAAYGLEFVEGTSSTSCYYRYNKSGTRLNIGEWDVPTHDPKVFEEKFRTFNKFFGTEFPSIKIYVFRVGNKDHFFYTLER